MTVAVTVIDYGVGNIFSVTRALEHCGATVFLSGRPADILSASRLVLPGVGAFASGMEGLRSRGLVDPIRRYAASGRPLLGICLGMQMLFSRSLEFGDHEGLGLIPGTIVPIVARAPDGAPLKVPHIGWAPLERPSGYATWDMTLLAGVREGENCYFVHSFTAVPERESSRLADTTYGDCRISAAVREGNVLGCQFHPEKSGETGLSMISNFVRM
jgi:glutamine amidotransferase